MRLRIRGAAAVAGACRDRCDGVGLGAISPAARVLRATTRRRRTGPVPDDALSAPRELAWSRGVRAGSGVWRGWCGGRGGCSGRWAGGVCAAGWGGDASYVGVCGAAGRGRGGGVVVVVLGRLWLPRSSRRHLPGACQHASPPSSAIRAGRVAAVTASPGRCGVLSWQPVGGAPRRADTRGETGDAAVGHGLDVANTLDPIAAITPHTAPQAPTWRHGHVAARGTRPRHRARGSAPRRSP